MKTNTLKNIGLGIAVFLFTFMLTLDMNAQDTTTAQDTTKTDKGPSAEELAKANNPLADLTAFNIQYYLRPKLNNVDNGMANTTWLRFATPTGRILWRLSVPLETRFVNNSEANISESGLGDIDLFAAYLAVMKPKVTFGVGPSASFNTASSDALGTGKNTLGLAAVGFAAPSANFQYGGLVIWRTDIGGDVERSDVSMLAVQPFYFFQLGKGFYFRGAPIMNFDLVSGHYSVPLGLGIGKVVKMGSTVLNFFVEPQPSILVNGPGQPVFQVYAALNMQF